MSDDFIANVETAFLKLLNADALLKQYNWQRWDSDAEVKLPRGLITINGRRDPEGSAIFRVEVEITFEGRPKHQRLSVIMNQAKTVFENANLSDLTNSVVQFFGRYAENVALRRQNVAGLRTWILTFTTFALPMT